jgi:Mn-dependent DtxR family transcriptional regulator
MNRYHVALKITATSDEEACRRAEKARRVTSASTTTRVLQYLHDHGPSGCSLIGTVIENRRNRRGGVSTNGGGDYAAQMLLGRMKRGGLVEHAPSDGSSLWQLTSTGSAKLKKTQQ